MNTTNPMRIKLLQAMYIMKNNYAVVCQLNSEFMGRGKGKSGNIPHNKTYIKSVALQVDRTNPIGYFS